MRAASVSSVYEDIPLIILDLSHSDYDRCFDRETGPGEGETMVYMREYINCIQWLFDSSLRYNGIHQGRSLPTKYILIRVDSRSSEFKAEACLPDSVAPSILSM
ncbi:hypothetical protein Droror1_Dr00005510 [Drosera rotundifolia]